MVVNENETSQNNETPEEEENLSVEEMDPLDSLFEERAQLKNIPKESEPSKEVISEKEKEVKTKESSPQKKVIRKDGEEEGEEESEDSGSETQKTKEELLKTQKRLSENQKYAHKHVQKVKNALKVTRTLVEEGNLTEEEAKILLETLQSEEEEPEEYYKGESHPFAPIYRVANKELENIRKYTDDEVLDDKIAAFNYFLSVSSKEEVESAYEELTDLMDNPVKLAKRMLSMGQETYEESYKNLKEAGGVKKYLAKKQQENERLQKEVDKLKKKLSQYETYDKPTYRIDEVAEKNTQEEESEDPLDSLFQARAIHIKRR